MYRITEQTLIQYRVNSTDKKYPVDPGLRTRSIYFYYFQKYFQNSFFYISERSARQKDKVSVHFLTLCRHDITDHRYEGPAHLFPFPVSCVCDGMILIRWSVSWLPCRCPGAGAPAAPICIDGWGREWANASCSPAPHRLAISHTSRHGRSLTLQLHRQLPRLQLRCFILGLTLIKQRKLKNVKTCWKPFDFNYSLIAK